MVAGVSGSGPGFRPSASLVRLRLVGSVTQIILIWVTLFRHPWRNNPSRSISLGSSLNGPEPDTPAPTPASKGSTKPRHTNTPQRNHPHTAHASLPLPLPCELTLFLPLCWLYRSIRIPGRLEGRDWARLRGRG